VVRRINCRGAKEGGEGGCLDDGVGVYSRRMLGWAKTLELKGGGHLGEGGI
jgi:hypothetical protein